jgi:hypothetical protein
LAKLNQDVFTLTLGSWQIPPRALILSKKKKQLKFKQYCRRLKENGDLSLSMLLMTDGIPTVDELMDSPLAKYITLAANDCGYSGTAEELIPIMDMVQLLAGAAGIPAGDVNMRVSVHEDNLGALVLAETLPPQFTPRSKYYATKNIWFCEEINKPGIKLLKIETSEQLGDMFTKGLAKTTFEYLRSKIIVW